MTNIICLMGPTASGKTALASELVQQFPVEIISVDSAMIYRGMDIGTAKPSALELMQAPHYLIDILDPPDIFSAADFCRETQALCDEIIGRGNTPLLVGGSMMYFHALQQGLSVLPEANEALREALLADAHQRGWAAMHEQLRRVDAVSANRIHPNDTQRIQRALEVFHLTGKPLSQLLAEQKNPSLFSFSNLSLLPENRSWLHERIELRFDTMLQQGFIEEVQHLLAQWQLSVSSPALRCVGYRQASDYLAGYDDYDTFRNKGIAATRQLAKRQLTWLRHWPNATKIACDESGCYGKIMAIVSEILDNPS